MAGTVYLLGSGIEQSLSPAIHRAAFAAAGLDWRYDLLDTGPHCLAQAIEQIRCSAGANVTMPFKQQVLPLLDRVDPEAACLGAVNTVVVVNGKLHGCNTDMTGLERDFKRLGIDPGSGPVLVAGAGGAAAAAAMLAGRAGARVDVICRRRQQGQEMLDRLSLPGQVLDWHSQVPGYKLLVNATPHHSGWMDFAGAAQQVYDLNYHHIHKSANWHNGLGMLVFQAARSFQLWPGGEPPLATMAKAAGLEI